MSERVIASLGAGPQRQLLAIASKTIEPYARRHGYDLQLHTEIADATRPAPWSKIRVLRDLIDRYELVLWLDADLVIVDGSVDIASELEDASFLYLVEHRAKGERRPNTGVMLLRAGDEAARFLDEVWALDRYVNHRWWENAAVCELLGYQLEPAQPIRETPLRAKTKFISPRWNSITDAPARHARIRHFPGFSIRTRKALMLASLAEARARGVRQRWRARSR